MNTRDSEIVRGMLEEKGYRFTEDMKEADVVIFNTCSVREHAEQKAVSMMGQAIKRLGMRNNAGRGGSRTAPTMHRHVIFGMIGCVAQHKKEALFKNLPELDFMAGPADIYRIPELIVEVKSKKSKVKSVNTETRPLDFVNPSYRESKNNAYVNISYGCDNFCSYCIVPYVRGREVSRPAADIVDEIKDLVKRGIKNITLLGQNVNSYKSSVATPIGLNEVSFSELLTMINDIKGLEKFNFMTSHPKDVSKELFTAIRDLDKLDKSLHLPIQSGSNKILKLMNRGYTAEKYLKLVEEYRRTVMGGKIGTDLIVGFPGETEKDFEETLELVKNVRFNSAYIFKYSPRPPAKSAAIPDDVSLDEKKRRHKILLDMQKKISGEKSAGADNDEN